MSSLSRHTRKRKERPLQYGDVAHPADEDNLAALITAVDKLNAGTRTHCSNRDARVANRSNRRTDIEESHYQKAVDSMCLLREQLGVLREEKQRLEGQVAMRDRPATIPFTGDMEQLLSRLEEITQREAAVLASLNSSAADGEASQMGGVCLADGREEECAAAALKADLELAREDELELADLREQKQALEERLAKLAVCWSPGGSPSGQLQGKRQCHSTLERVHDWLYHHNEGFPSTAIAPMLQGGTEDEGRQELLLKARAALKATDSCLGRKWDPWTRPPRAVKANVGPVTSDGDHSMCVQLDTSEF